MIADIKVLKPHKITYIACENSLKSETIFIKTYLVHMQIMMIVDLMIYAIFMIHKSEFFSLRFHLKTLRYMRFQRDSTTN